MLKSEVVIVNGKPLLGIRVNLPNAPVLMLVGSKGFIGCGYFKTEVADKVGHALAVVSGVKTFDDMLEAVVSAASGPASQLGIVPGIRGKDAAELLAG